MTDHWGNRQPFRNLDSQSMLFESGLLMNNWYFDGTMKNFLSSVLPTAFGARALMRLARFRVSAYGAPSLASLITALSPKCLKAVERLLIKKFFHRPWYNVCFRLAEHTLLVNQRSGAASVFGTLEAPLGTLETET